MLRCRAFVGAGRGVVLPDGTGGTGSWGFSRGLQRTIASSRDNRAEGEARATARPQRRDHRSHERGHRTPHDVQKTKTLYRRPPARPRHGRSRSVSEDGTNVPPRRWLGERSCGWAGSWPRAGSRFWRGRKIRLVSLAVLRSCDEAAQNSHLTLVIYLARIIAMAREGRKGRKWNEIQL